MFLKEVLTFLPICIVYQSYAREIPVFHEINAAISESAGTHGCVININQHLSRQQPLLIVPNTSQFVQPQNKTGDIFLEPNEEVELFCSKHFQFPYINSNTAIVSCIENATVLFNKVPIDFKSINCSSYAFHSIRHTNRSCYDNSELVQIGFNVTNDRFLDLIDVCYNHTQETTLFTHHIQTPQNIGFQRSVKRPSFLRGEFFKRTPQINKLFNVNKQKAIFEQTLGHCNISTHFSNNKKSLFLVRGHLSPKADFLFGPQQRATFWLVNAAPQWQSFNSGHWERIETGVRQLIADRNIMANIYTGTYGVLSFDDVLGQPQPIYLSKSKNNGSGLFNRTTNGGGLSNCTINGSGPSNSTINDQSNSTINGRGLSNSTINDLSNSTINGSGLFNSTINDLSNSTINGKGLSNSTINGDGLVPVPKLFYKLVLTLDAKMGVVLIGVNNPFATIEEIESEYVICEDVADELKWLKWDRKNIVKGYIYACNVNEFVGVVKHLPINVTDHVNLLV